MKKILFPLLLLFALFTTFSCKNNKKSEDEMKKEFQATLTQEDTTAMLQLCDDCMELLKAGKIDDALASLNEYDDSLKSVSPLSEATTNRYKRIFSMFPVCSYVRAYYSFQLEGLNDVKYQVCFSKTDSTMNTAYMFNPIKLDGKWYLTVKRADQGIDELHR